MESPKQLADRFREVILNGTWIANTNFKHQLSEVTWQQATHKVGSLNTIAALTFHINYYIGGINQVFAGGTLDIRDRFSFDFAPVTSQEDWDAMRDSLWANAEKFANYVEQMTDAQLEAGFVDVRYGTYRRNIEGMIEHSYYHLGQVSLIRKMILGI